MPYEPFYERFRELALRETRSFMIVENQPRLPADEYALVDPKHFPPPGAAKRLDVLKPKSRKRKRH